MTAAVQPTMHALRPFWGRVTVLPSPVDEIQRDSGVIVPIGREQSEYDRGVILHVAHEGMPPEILGTLVPGRVIYYADGQQVGDVIIVEINDIVAYLDEEADG